VSLSWKFDKNAQKTWTFVNLPIPKLPVEPSLLPTALEQQLVICGGEMMPGMLNFMMFGVSAHDADSEVRLQWSKPQIKVPVWAYGMPYCTSNEGTFFLNSCDSHEQ